MAAIGLIYLDFPYCGVAALAPGGGVSCYVFRLFTTGRDIFMGSLFGRLYDFFENHTRVELTSPSSRPA